MTIDNNQEVDVLNLPPRTKKHGKRSKAKKEDNKKHEKWFEAEQKKNKKHVKRSKVKQDNTKREKRSKVEQDENQSIYTRRGKQQHEEDEQETQNSKKESKRKLNYAIIRLLLTLFILIVILLITHQKWEAHVNLPFSSKPTTTTDNLAGEQVKVLPNNSGSHTIGLEAKPNVAIEPETSVDEDENENEEPEQIQPPEAQEEPVVSGEESNQPQYYQVMEEDTLFSIAIKFYGSKQGMEILKEANELTSDQVNIGEVLLIPKQEQKK
ncbi:LysM peptidoglycan-binding domain-containing protein [Radiobacillus sp. PE A8.2]|uniref:LysM peptidoglycan-binding domain-containing protein n=1 Tax=Radiobacillus sp. PE A8.2 TaxID=3380349 RepID=UPI0038904435